MTKKNTWAAVNDKTNLSVRLSYRRSRSIGIGGMLALIPFAMMSCIADPILVQGTGGGGGAPPACLEPSDCPAADNPCLSAVCVGGFCGTTNTPVGITCDADGAMACDGMTNCKPVNGQTCTDGAACLSGICVDGVCCDALCNETCKSCNVPGAIGSCVNIPISEVDDNGSPACTGAAAACDGLGVCKSSIGQTCANAADCALGFCVDGVCCDAECSGTCVACSATGKGAGMDGVCEFVMTNVDTADECANGACDGAGVCKIDNGSACAGNDDCFSGFCVDGICCDTACSGTCESCTALVQGQGQDGICGPIIAGTDTQDECNSGVCDGTGACKTSNGAACAVGADCFSGFCADGVCCDKACTGLCEACSATAQGQGQDGVCGPIDTGLDPANECANGACSGTGTCNIDSGQACTMNGQCGTGFCVDGYCCNTACLETCKACNISGLQGTCSNLPALQQDTNATMQCSLATVACDGNGNCKKKGGETCAAGTDCLTGFCADGICCNAACTEQCKTCNLAGKVGTCSNIAAGADDTAATMTCSGTTQSCDGNSNCKKENGQTCSAGTTCLSGFCADGVCCNAGCTETCKSCKNAGNVGTCSNIVKGSDDTNASMACSGAMQSCDGTGLCKSENGQTCTMGTNCLSGNCVDGVCCDTTCTGACKACNVSGNVGTCSNVPFGQDDPNTCTTAGQSCDGGGTCKKEIGQTCSVNADCLQGTCDGGTCTGPSCNGLAGTCGKNKNERCCQSTVITGGTFNRINKPQYPTTVSDFRLDRFEVTVGRFRKFVNAYPGSKPAPGAGAHPLIASSGWNSTWNTLLPVDQTALNASLHCQPILETWTDVPGSLEDRPINCVNWYVAFAFCAWDGGRLLTDAEWNYAAAGGSEQRIYPWGPTAPSTSRAVYECLADGVSGCSQLDILNVGSKSTLGDGKWNQADLAGNMLEWTLDLYAPYTTPCNNCANLTNGTSRMIRGGSWRDPSPLIATDVLSSKDATSRAEWLGFRCAVRTP